MILKHSGAPPGQKMLDVPTALKKRPWNAGEIIRNAFRFVDCVGECRAHCCRSMQTLMVTAKDPNFHKIMAAARHGKFDAKSVLEQTGVFMFLRANRDACGFLDLETSNCRIYDIRPSMCRAYPFLAFQTKFQTEMGNGSELILRLTTQCPPVAALAGQGIEVITLADVAGTSFLYNAFSQQVSSIQRREYPEPITLLGNEENRRVPIF